MMVVCAYIRTYLCIHTHAHTLQERSPQYFGDFSKAQLTLIQIATFDGWVDTVLRQQMLPPQTVDGVYYPSEWHYQVSVTEIPTIIDPRGTVNYPSAAINYPSATINYPSATVNYPSATINYPSATINYPSATINYPSADYKLP